MLLIAGLHVPVILLSDVVGSALKVAPLHIGDTALNVGVTAALTVTVSVAVVAQVLPVGVNV